VFDTAVNLGRARTNRMLEQLTSNNPKQKALDLIKLRKQHYERLVLKRRSFQKFLKGWLNRVSDLEKEAFFR
jgi:lysozyme family protein